jgi:predicted GIY-YIG superfamily endonuclease
MSAASSSSSYYHYSSYHASSTNNNNNNKRSAQIYILRLEHEKYYIGRTEGEVDKRFAEHLSGQQGVGSAWTMLHPPIEVIQVHPMTSQFDEDKYVKEAMQRWGIDNVRGGTYCQVNLGAAQREALEKELVAAADLCYYCKQVGHYIRNCPQKPANNNNNNAGKPRFEKPRFPSSSDNTGTIAPRVVICFKCRKPGHYANVCPQLHY